MGEMLDENTGEKPQCVYCGSEEDCEHLVAVLDVTFHECEAGYLAYEERDAAFRQTLQDGLLPLLKSDTAMKWENEDLANIWDHARKNFNRDDTEVDIEAGASIVLIGNLLLAAGAVKHPGDITEDWGAPGFCSKLHVFYAKKPKEVVDAALAALKRMLAPDSLTPPSKPPMAETMRRLREAGAQPMNLAGPIGIVGVKPPPKKS